MITRFSRLFDTTARPDSADWSEIFAEFSQPRAFLGADDHPGWSAAEFNPPKRELKNVRCVHAMVLDYDKGTTLEEAEKFWHEYYGLIHTTRRHTAAAPRFRVILPMTRAVSAFEYVALWQRVRLHAGKIDEAPKDPSRFWYVPGISDHEGAEFKTIELTGAYFDPDEWLTRPAPAAQATSMPDNVTPITAASREARARAYIRRMPEAISGANGHSTLWNVARKLICDFELNADSAYRILATEYNPRCRPPWSEKELRHKIDDAVNKARVRNPVEDRDPPKRATGTDQGAPDPGPPPRVEPNEDHWRRGLRYKQDGTLTKDVGNATLILKNAAGWRGCLEFDSMAYRVQWSARPDFAIGIQAPRAGEHLQDHHIVYVQHCLAKIEGLSIGKDVAWSAVEAAAHEYEVHPVQDYLRSLQWDNKRRLHNWLSTYLGAQETDYSCAVGRWWLISAVARAFSPGCQADHVLILEGQQGKGKSQAMRLLSEPWYLGSLPDIRDRDRAAATIGGYWVVEIAELDALKGAAATRTKEFVSQGFDVYRPAYGRSTLSRPRSCVFVGTTNENAYLTDPTGARRFWPVAIAGDIDGERLAKDRDQLWAEACIAFDVHEPWWPDREYSEMISEQQEERYTEDDWMPRVMHWVADREEPFTGGDVLAGALSLDPGKWDRGSQTRIGAILHKLGYRVRRVADLKTGGRVRKYFKGQDNV